MNVCFSVSENCQNLYDSYGEICVRCNCCGKVDEKTKYEARLELYKRQLRENEEFNGWFDGIEEMQRKNVQENIYYLKNKIAELEGM